MALVHPLSRRLFHPPEGDLLDPCATLANTADAGAAFADGTLRQVNLALGFHGAWLVEEGVAFGEGGFREYAPLGARQFPSFFEMLRDGIDDAQRAALDLGPDRFAALGALDALRERIAAGDLAGARRRGQGCLAALGAAFAPATPAGEGRIRRPVVRDAATLARLAERALATFLYDPAEALGRVRQVLRSAADLDGGPRAPWESRDDRGRRAAFFTPGASPAEVIASIEEFAETIALPRGLVHPAMRPVEAPGPDGAAAHEAARDGAADRGPRAIGEAHVVRVVPVVPEDERPALFFPARDEHAGETIVDDPLTALYGALRRRVERYGQLAHYGAPEVLLDTEARAMQRVFDDLVAMAPTPPDAATLDGWGPPGVRRERVALTYGGGDPEGDPDTDMPPSLLWLTEDTAVVAKGDVAAVISLSAQRVVRRVAIGPARLQACDDAGRLVLVSTESMSFDGDAPDGFGCFDATTGEWLDALPAHLPAVAFGKDDPEDGVLYELRRGRSVAVGGDRPAALAWSRGNRAVLVGGDGASVDGLRSVATGLVEVSGAAFERRRRDAPMLLADGTVVASPSDEDAERLDDAMAERWEDRRYRPWPAAIGAGGRLLLPDLTVGDLAGVACRLGFAVDAAAFSPDGGRLLVLGDGLSIVDPAGPTIAWRWPRRRPRRRHLFA